MEDYHSLKHAMLYKHASSKDYTYPKHRKTKYL